MANVQKYTASASGALAAHYERRKDEQGGYIKLRNQDIDPAKSHLNYNLARQHDDGQMNFIKQRISEVRCQKRADVNVMCSWVVTLPTYHHTNPNMHVTPNREEIERLFFKSTYQFLADRYGESNVISAYVHKDEKTPHMHFSFVPVTEDKKRGCYKVSAKEVLTRQDLKTFHTDLERHLDTNDRNWHFNVINEATKDGNKEIAELKKQTAHAEVQQATQKATEAINNMNALERQKNTLQGEIESLQTVKEELTAAEVEALKGTKTITGALKGVSYIEYEALKATAVKVKSMEAERDRAEKRASAAEQKVKTAYADANAKLAAKIKEVENDRPSMKMYMEVDKLEKENKRLTILIEKIQNFLEKRFPQVYEALKNTLKNQSRSQEKNSRNRGSDRER